MENKKKSSKQRHVYAAMADNKTGMCTSTDLAAAATESHSAKIAASACDKELLSADNSEYVLADLELMKEKPKLGRKRRQSTSHEEDVIDGFLIVSYSTVQELEADGPIRPGAAVGRKTGKPRDKKKGRGLGKKNKKSENGMPPEKEAVSEPKRKKKRQQSLADCDPPSSSSPLAVLNSDGNSQLENDLSSSKSSPGPILSVVASKAEGTDKLKPEVCEPDSGKRSVSDFSIKAIQSFPSDATVSPASPRQLIQNTTTMTSLASRNASVSPMTLSFQRALSRGDAFHHKFAAIESSSIGGRMPPITECLSRKSESIFVDGNGGSSGGRILQISETSKIRLAVSTGGGSQSNVIFANAASGHLTQDRDGTHFYSNSTNRVTSTADGDKSTARAETHQHQHQHIHQHQHQHQHQHFHPPYPSPAGHAGTVPPAAPQNSGQYNPMYFGGGFPYMPVAQNQAPHRHALVGPRKRSKLCALHVQIARFIQKLKAEKFPVIQHDLDKAGRTGFHAFQAVQSRGHDFRDVGFRGPHYHSSSHSPKGGGTTHAHHSGARIPPSLVRNASEQDTPFPRSRSFAPVYHGDQVGEAAAAPLPFGGLGSAFSGSASTREQARMSPPSRFGYNNAHNRVEYDRFRSTEGAPFVRPAGFRIDSENHSESERRGRFASLLFDKDKHGTVSKYRPLTIDPHDRRSPPVAHISADYFSGVRKLSPHGAHRVVGPGSSSSLLLKPFESRFMDTGDSFPRSHAGRHEARPYSPAGRPPFPAMPTGSRQNALACLGMQNLRYSGHQT